MAELEKYDRRGRLINSDPGYEGSPIDMLEKFVTDKFNSIRNYIGSDLVLGNDNFSKLFFAIVAPSMTGKTQAAFAFKTLKCLYFLLYKSSTGNLQEIYNNFDTLSETFRTLVDEDFAKLKKLNVLKKKPGDIFHQISSNSLLHTHGDTKFKTLGFIYSMIEHSNANFDPTGYQSWMNFYATSPRSFIVEAKSINEFKNLNISNYVLFFDEFEASEANAFVRNLFRTAFAPVFAANTNSNAANLIGKVNYSCSREGDSLAWSLAAIKLNSINQSILTGMHPSLIKNIATIIERASNNDERVLIQEFFKNFFETQLEHLRPGCADIIAAKVHEISTSIQITSLNGLLQHFLKALFAKMVNNKPAIKNELEGILGSLALLMDNAYLSSNISTEKLKAKMSHMKSYLQYHYYYLINPVDVTKWCFLTYRPKTGKVPLRVLFQRRKFKEWDVEYTYFRAEEMIPFFALQSITTKNSIPNTLKTGLKISDADPRTTGRAPNTSDELEVLSSICIIEASQHGVGEILSSFAGQDGKTFLTNLIGNLIEADDFRRTAKLELNCEIMKNILDRVHIPFLFPAGMKLSDFLKNNFSRVEGFKTRTVNFGEFRRTRNSTEIDGIFNYFIKTVTEEFPSVGVCSVECKNRIDNLLANDLILILEKAKRKLANITLLFCNSLGDSRNSTLTNFASFCTNNKFAVLKLEQTTTNKKFKLVPYCSGLPFPNDTVIELTCIIIELDVINNPLRTRY